MIRRGLQFALALIWLSAMGTAAAQRPSSPALSVPDNPAPVNSAPERPASDIRAPLNIVPGAPEEIARVPSHFVWLRSNLQAVLDPLDGQMVLFDDDGRVVGRISLPDDFHAGEAMAEPDRVRLVDRDGARQVVIPRNIDVATRALSDAAVPRGAPTRQSRLSRSGPQQMWIDGGGSPLRIRSLVGGELAQAYEIGSGRGGERYVVSEEIVEGSPEIVVRVFVHRFDAAGRLTGLAHVPLDNMETVPPDFVTVTGDGVVRALAPAANGVSIREIAFSDSPPGADRGELRAADALRLGNVAREIVIESTVERRSEPVRPRTDAPRFRVEAHTPPISRREVLAEARRYLTVDWVLSRDNFSKLAIQNRCQPDRLMFWRRPAKFSPQHIGRTIGPMPYQWGGQDTPKRFRARIVAGALAGDVCTCRSAALGYCLVTEAAGADCSGFLSNVWGIQRRGTAGMLDVSHSLSGLSVLQPGDALLIPNRHVMLVVGRRSGPALSYVVIESTTKRACEGVCESVYRPSELNGFRPIRYRGIVD